MTSHPARWCATDHRRPPSVSLPGKGNATAAWRSRHTEAGGRRSGARTCDRACNWRARNSSELPAKSAARDIPGLLRPVLGLSLCKPVR